MAKTTKKVAVDNVEAEDQPLYLSHARLQGYLTLKDCSVDFKPGLNIIIGKNGAGKTNFLTLLSKSLDCDLDNEYFQNIETELKGVDDFIITIDRNPNKNNGDDNSYRFDNISYAVKINGEDQKVLVNGPYSILPLAVQTQLIQHGIPTNYPIVQSSFSFNLALDKSGSAEIFQEIRSLGSYFKNCLIREFLYLSYDGNNSEKIKNKISDAIKKVIYQIKPLLTAYTEIKDLRVKPSIDIRQDSNMVYVSDIQLEFHINSSWVLFDQMSDGTKRAFYVITEIGVNSEFYFKPRSIGLVPNLDRIIFLEEPELSLHPHLLTNLMDFIKEESKTKQIIITTHSPQVLDILTKDELDRIVIASYEPEKGTQMRHLSKAEQAKAKKYLDTTGFISDYWRLSDLEK